MQRGGGGKPVGRARTAAMHGLCACTCGDCIGVGRHAHTHTGAVVVWRKHGARRAQITKVPASYARNYRTIATHMRIPRTGDCVSVCVCVCMLAAVTAVYI